MHTTIAALLANKANTRLVLATALAERNAECIALRARPVAPAAKTYAAIKTVAPRATWVRPAHMEAARQLAMSSGSVVRV